METEIEILHKMDYISNNFRKDRQCRNRSLRWNWAAIHLEIKAQIMESKMHIILLIMLVN